jgi:RimJ/RimL family protein N-acetyltransferase
MQMNIFEGEKVRLRAIEPEDWEVNWEWGTETESARASYWIPFPQSRATAQRQAEKPILPHQGDNFTFIIETLAGEMVGNIKTLHCNPRFGTFSYGLAVREAHQRQGYATEAIRLVLSYYFRELRYQKCTVHVYAFNEASFRLHEKLGFQPEGRLRRMIFTNGAYHDEVVLGLTAEEFEARQGRT